MNDWTILLLAFGIPVVLLLVWHVVREIRERLSWNRMWKDLADIANMDKGRARWHHFLREEGYEETIPLPKAEEMFQKMWKDTMSKRKDCKE